MTTVRRAQTRKRLEAVLASEGNGFEFVQVMRLLARLYPDRASIGGWDDPADEVVRLSVPPSFAFPPSEVAFLQLPQRTGAGEGSGAVETPARMGVRFLGLIGPQGVLPHVYTCLLYTSPSPRDRTRSRMPSSA